MRRLLLTMATSGLLMTAAHAQGGYTIFTPGQPLTFVNPNAGGGYVVTTPGRPTTYVDPNGGGGYTITTPGQPTTFVNPPPAFRTPCSAYLVAMGKCSNY
jgi:hypothetical protein